LAEEIDIVRDAREKCLELLARREHSQKQLVDKLTLKGYPIDLVEDIVCQLAEQGLQNDFRFAECYSRQRIEKGYGPLRIQYELQQKGVEGFALDEVIEESAGSWDGLLKQVYLRKYSGDKMLTRQEWAKRSRFLQQRGFSSEMIMNLFKQLAIKFD